MKVGDIVMSTKVRPYENARVIQADISTRLKDNGKKETRTKYLARYSDGTTLPFCGANVNKSVFLVLYADGQMTLSDFMNMDIYEEG